MLVTEGLTAAGILLLLPLPLAAALAVLPLIGVALNGTSSVLYGTVPELVMPERRARAFGIFYTGTIGAGALAPAIYGLVSDAARCAAHDGAGRRDRAADLAAGLGAASGVAAPLDNGGRGSVGLGEQITNPGAIVTRASRQVQREAERQFPVRVRIAVPPEGLGRQLELMHAWLDEVCGVAGWSSAPAGTAGVVNDAIAFYFESAGVRLRLCRPLLLRLSGGDDRRLLCRSPRPAGAAPRCRRPQNALAGLRLQLRDDPRLGRARGDDVCRGIAAGGGRLWLRGRGNAAFLMLVAPQAAIPLVVIIATALTAAVLPGLRRAVAPGLLLRLALGSLIGLPPGLAAFHYSNATVVRVVGRHHGSRLCRAARVAAPAQPRRAGGPVRDEPQPRPCGRCRFGRR